MGVDKKNIRTVIHMEPPLTVEAYLQESGRAGRDREQAEAVLMISGEDIPGNKSENGQGTNSITESRYQDFIVAVNNNSKCRRESLLSLLGAENIIKISTRGLYMNKLCLGRKISFFKNL